MKLESNEIKVENSTLMTIEALHEFESLKDINKENRDLIW